MPQMRPIASRSRYFILLDRRVPIFSLCILDNINSETRANSSKPAWRKVSKFSILSRTVRFWNCRDRGSTYEWFISGLVARSASRIVSPDRWEFFLRPGFFDHWIWARLDWVMLFWRFAFKYGAALKGLRQCAITIGLDEIRPKVLFLGLTRSR